MRLIASSLMAGLIAFSSVAPAFADPPRRGHDDRGRGHDRDWNDRDYRDGYRDARRDDRRQDRRDYRSRGRGWYDSRGDHHDWRRGDRFDDRRHTGYVVFNDYHRYRLPPPRRGEYYYRDDRTGEILLIAAATGLVLWALTN
ncbi:MAG: RcnB family protein [Hyphomonadaceae bacterium]